MTTDAPYQEAPRLTWYRPHLERDVLVALTQRSNWRGFVQALGHLGLWCLTGTTAYAAFLNVATTNWFWSLPLLYLALFAHGTVAGFFGGTACHELGHRTVFKTKLLNEIFLRIFAFLGWWNHVWFKPSHMKHHQVTTHNDYDGEVVLPQYLSFKDWPFWLGLFGWNPLNSWLAIKRYVRRARGLMDDEWYAFLMPDEKGALRRKNRNWARWHLAGHAILAATFIATGHWFLILLVNFGSQMFGLLGFLCGTPQHFGMQANVTDHRRCCRTYISRGLPAFLYWNMQYHIEHHMFPAVPFFRLPKLRSLIEHDLPPAPRGLRATWAEILAIHRRQRSDPNYCFIPKLPNDPDGDFASDLDLEREASGAVA